MPKTQSRKPNKKITDKCFKQRTHNDIKTLLKGFQTTLEVVYFGVRGTRTQNKPLPYTTCAVLDLTILCDTILYHSILYDTIRYYTALLSVTLGRVPRNPRCPDAHVRGGCAVASHKFDSLCKLSILKSHVQAYRVVC